MSVNKKDFSNLLSKKLNISKKDSLSLVNSFFHIIVDNHEAGININNFGSFSFKKTPKRVGRNPKTLENFEIRPRKKLNFTPSDSIKKIIN